MISQYVIYKIRIAAPAIKLYIIVNYFCGFSSNKNAMDR